jgi:oligopeptide transport system substrate-binding protein
MALVNAGLLQGRFRGLCPCCVAYYRVMFLGVYQANTYKKSCFRMNLWADPATLDPRKARDINAITMCRMLFEGLTRISKEGKPELALAETVEISEDGHEYVFHLRKVTWSNGNPVTSYDFAESWKNILHPDFPTDIAFQLYLIQNAKDVKLGNKGSEELGIQTPDPLTLIVHLKEPTPYFLEVCAMPAFFPVPRRVAAENSNWVFHPTTFVGNGPFVLKTWNHTDEIRVVKNPKYWDASRVHLQEVSLVMVSSDTEMQMFEDGQLDLAGALLSSLPIDAIEHLKETGQLKVSPVSGTKFLRVNTSEKIGGKPNILSLVECRKALSCAIDRSAITKDLLHGIKSPARSFVPPEMELFSLGFFSDQQRDIANILFLNALESMELTTAALQPIVLSFIDIELNRALAQVIQQQWETVLGIKILLQALESKVFYQKLRERDYQVVLSSWIADFNDPINFLEVFKFKEGGSNNTNWENAKYIELLNQSTICRDQTERRRILQEAEEILMEQMPIIPLYHEAMNFLQRSEVQDMALSPIGQVD